MAFALADLCPEIAEGHFFDSFAGLPPAGPLDGDWYESTLCILDNLFDRVMPGGVVLIDDYYDWDGCSRAVHDFLSARKATERIRPSRFGGVAYMIRDAH